MNANATGRILLSIAFAALLAAPTISLAATAPKPSKTAAAKDAAAKPAKNAPLDDSGTWLLAGREGECAPVSILEKKGEQLKGVKSPLQLKEKLKALGHPAEVKEFKAGIRPAVEVRAPSAGIHVMFVRQENCDKKPVGAEKK
ncbi:MAG: hypothetical protein EXR70_09840 [Deltaproteobacteria bacterium]|nr:hypothetical protein [Deltaproteobacteria bacterium]